MIFEDPEQKRWKIAQLILWLAGFVVLIIGGDLLLSLFYSPQLPKLSQFTMDDRGGVYKVLDQTTDNDMPLPVPANLSAEGRKTAFYGHTFWRTAFMIQDDLSSVRDLKKHIEQLDAVFPDWYIIDHMHIKESIMPETTAILRHSGALILPRIVNTDIAGNWGGEIICFPDERSGAITRVHCRLVGKSAGEWCGWDQSGY